MPAHTPSSPPHSPDAVRLEAEIQLGPLYSQVAVVRALADQVEFLARSAISGGLDEQLVEEMTRLGCRLLESAASLSKVAVSVPEDSGVFGRQRSTTGDELTHESRTPS